MKIKILLLVLVSVVGFSQKKKINEEYDYINNYYQLVYQAHFEYLNEDYQKAYDLLKTAEKNCPLLNQTGIYEPRILAECATFLNKPKEAVYYLEILVRDYGYSFNSIKNDSIFLNIQNTKSWKKLHRNKEKYAKNYREKVDFNLRKELHQMKIDDQSVRTNGYDEEKAKLVDSVNQLKLYKIVVDYDFFPGHSFNQVGNYNVDNYDPEISVLVMHIRSSKADFWKPILLDLIKRGRASAKLYGNLSDSILRSNGVFDYGIYQNIEKEKINDYGNLDKRRIAVGLPTLAYQNFVYEYWENMFKKYNEQNGN